MRSTTRSTIRKSPTIRESPQKITRKIIAINTNEDRITELFENKQINIQITNTNNDNDNSSYQKFFRYFNTVRNFLTIFKCKYDEFNRLYVKTYNNTEYKFSVYGKTNNIYLYNIIDNSYNENDIINMSDFLLFTDSNNENFIISNNKLFTDLSVKKPSLSVATKDIDNEFNAYNNTDGYY